MSAVWPTAISRNEATRVCCSIAVRTSSIAAVALAAPPAAGRAKVEAKGKTAAEEVGRPPPELGFRYPAKSEGGLEKKVEF